MVTTALYMAAETKPRYSWATGGGLRPWTMIVRTAMASQVVITAGSRATAGVAWAGLVSAPGVATSKAATTRTRARIRMLLHIELPSRNRASWRAIGGVARRRRKRIRGPRGASGLVGLSLTWAWAT